MGSTHKSTAPRRSVDKDKMMISDWLSHAERRLAAAGVDSPRIEAQLLAAHVLLVDRSWILAHPSGPIPELAAEALLQRREAREPLAYILGRREFYGLPFAVRPAVLIPRQETETIVEAALAEPQSDEATPQPTDQPSFQQKTRVLDLGTGSGILAITLKLQRPDWVVTASDVSESALAVALENAENLGADVRFVQSDGFQALRCERFDLIVTNPPYVAAQAPLPPEVRNFEPHVALFAGESGLDFYGMLAREAHEHLAAGGGLIAEVGDGMAESVITVFTRAGWHVRSEAKDLLGTVRCLVLAPN
jgi:release factor glutamine methyltransferase